MTTSGNTRRTPTLNLRLVSKWLKLNLQATIPSFHLKWLVALVGAALLWWIPNLSEYINILISLLNK